VRPIGDAIARAWGADPHGPAARDPRVLEALHMVSSALRIVAHAAECRECDWADNTVWRLRDAENLLRHGNRGGRP
jgi:hypothetical protein